MDELGSRKAGGAGNHQDEETVGVETPDRQSTA